MTSLNNSSYFGELKIILLKATLESVPSLHSNFILNTLQEVFHVSEETDSNCSFLKELNLFLRS